MKHTRAKHTKSRRGCITCKIRHVKCDEQQPECLQCIKTGRKCDGYDPKQTNPQAQQRTVVDPVPEAWTKLSADQRLVLRPGTREERQYIEFFCTRTSRALSGFFDSDLWGYVLPQLSHSEAAIRHAVIALGALHQHLHIVLSKDRCDPGRKIAPQNEQFIIQQYNSAIRHLVTQLSSANQVPHLTLIACCLFVCLEILSGQVGKALDHIEAGLKIVQRWENDPNGKLQSEGITRELTYTVVRWNTQLSKHGRRMISLNLSQLDPADSVGKSETWSDISAARHSLDVLINRAISFVETVGTDRKTRGSPWQVCRQQALLQDFAAWLSAFDSLMKRSGRRLKKTDPRGPLVLRIHHRTNQVIVAVALSRDELIFDQLDDDFRAIVAYAEELIELNASLDRDSLLTVFSMETGLISSLCYTASKCRNPVLRRKAISLLYRCPQKEGLWSMQQYAILARIIVQIDEEVVAHLPLEQRIPEDRHRVYTAHVENRTCQSCRLVLRRMPEADDVDWHCRVRDVDFATEVQAEDPSFFTEAGISWEI
ncbi:NAD(P)H-dependent FMN reductase C4B3.06c [Aspergillus udagawae]|uniref:NAD(P)H-dependent FMN reductase C4B3.06c n=1 Tax=Aspergillus udagawae TaxID=91492 RepID=A0A8H3S2D3_9EURO|nr:NAD(P)H-dependent FMN reductase C4B3.06c [Aspergillus udagawae]